MKKIIVKRSLSLVILGLTATVIMGNVALGDDTSKVPACSQFSQQLLTQIKVGTGSMIPLALICHNGNSTQIAPAAIASNTTKIQSSPSIPRGSSSDLPPPPAFGSGAADGAFAPGNMPEDNPLRAYRDQNQNQDPNQGAFPPGNHHED